MGDDRDVVLKEYVKAQNIGKTNYQLCENVYGERSPTSFISFLLNLIVSYSPHWNYNVFEPSLSGPYKMQYNNSVFADNFIHP